jgi:hypothetical protein
MLRPLISKKKKKTERIHTVFINEDIPNKISEDENIQFDSYKYRWMNIIKFIILFINTCVIIVLKYVDDLSYVVPVNVIVADWEILNPEFSCYDIIIGNTINTCTITYVSKHVGNFDIINLLIIGGSISTFIFFILFNIHENYMEMLYHNNNYIKWIDNTFVMILAVFIICGLSGFNDLLFYISLITIVVNINFLFYLQEIILQFMATRASTPVNIEKLQSRDIFLNVVEPNDRHWFVKYSATITSILLYIVLWTIIFIQFGMSYNENENDKFPSYISLVLFTIFCLLTLYFTINLLVVSNHINYMKGELSSNFVSLILNISLTWLVIYSVFRNEI